MAPKSPLLAHCRRELFHAVWHKLLYDDFLHAYEFGMVLVCPDGVTRRVYPRIIAYSADYPEKYVFDCIYHAVALITQNRTLIATIRNLGGLPCPLCMVEVDQIQDIGLKRDMDQREKARRRDDELRERLVNTARRRIYDQRMGVNSAGVEKLLRPLSLVPTIVS